MRKKNNSKTVKQAVKPVEVKKEETVAQPVSEPKADAKADVKAEVEKAVEKTTEQVEKAVEKTTEKVAEKAAEVKDTVKKTTAKAAKAAKTAKEAKPAKKEPVKPEIIVQYQNSEVDTAAVEERVKAQFVAEGHKAGFIRKLNIYIKPEEYSAYYVINDKFSGRVDLFQSDIIREYIFYLAHNKSRYISWRHGVSAFVLCISMCKSSCMTV